MLLYSCCYTTALQMTTLFSFTFLFFKGKKNPNWRCHWHRTRSLCYCEQSRSQQTEEETRQAQFGMYLEGLRLASRLFFFLARTFRVSFTDFSFFVLAPNVAYHLPQLPTRSQCPTLEACHMVLHPVWQMRAIFTLAASDNSCPTSKTLMFLVCYKSTKDWDGAWVLCQWDTGHVVLQILNKQCQRNG